MNRNFCSACYVERTSFGMSALPRLPHREVVVQIKSKSKEHLLRAELLEDCNRMAHNERGVIVALVIDTIKRCAYRTHSASHEIIVLRLYRRMTMIVRALRATEKFSASLTWRA